MTDEKPMNLDPVTAVPGMRPMGTGDIAGAVGDPESVLPAEVVDAAASGEIASNDEVIDTLNDLLEACRDGEYGFAACAEHTSSTDLQTLLLRHAGECRTAALELQTLIRQLGGEADEGGTVSGALHRGWVSVRGTLGGYSDQAMLDECERGEDSAVASYHKALRTHLPSAVRNVVERQAQGAQRNHDQVKVMRDALKAKG
ncbi:MAG: ferritin-like domain-containing protein [Polaromonas sp.]